MSAAFDSLQAAYRARDDGWRAVRKAGQAVVGYVGNTVPVELIAACGALPWRVAPIAGSTAVADEHIEAFSDLDVRLSFARFVEGAYDDLDLLVIPRSTETQHKLYLALREAVRTGLKAGGPALHLYDIVHTQREPSRAYGLARTADLLERVAEVAGHQPSDADLARAIAAGNGTRALLGELQRRRASGAVSGWQAQVATGALRFMAPQAGQDTLAAWLAESSHRVASGPRLLVTGVPLDHDALHARVEALGANIVAEDDDWGARAAEPLVSTSKPPLEALFEHHWRDVPCPRIHPAPADGGWFARHLQQGGIDGVLFNLARPDDIHGWTYPAQRALAEAAGLPSCVLRDDARDTTCSTALDAVLAPFIQRLR